MDRRRRDGVDQSVINLGHGQAKVADLARLVSQRLGLVDGAEELGERQCDAKAIAQSRVLRVAVPTPWISPQPASGRAYGIRRPSTTTLSWLMASPQPDLAVPRQLTRESARLFMS